MCKKNPDQDEILHELYWDGIPMLQQIEELRKRIAEATMLPKEFFESEKEESVNG